MSEDPSQVPDSPSPQPPPSPQRADRRHRWDTIGVIIASLVGLLALLVSGYTAYIQRQQVRAEVWPYLEITTSDLLPSDYVADAQEGMVLGKGGRFYVVNKGVGPAILQRVEVTVNGRPQTGWKGVMEALGTPRVHWLQFKFSGTVVSPGETVNVLSVPDQEDWIRIKSKLYGGSDKVIIQACYHSTLGDYWLASARFHSHNVRGEVRAVHDCRVIPKEAEFKW